jgi:hypothetical protein
VGIDISNEFSNQRTDEIVRAAEIQAHSTAA